MTTSKLRIGFAAIVCIGIGLCAIGWLTMRSGPALPPPVEVQPEPLPEDPTTRTLVSAGRLAAYRKRVADVIRPLPIASGSAFILREMRTKAQSHPDLACTAGLILADKEFSGQEAHPEECFLALDSWQAVGGGEVEAFSYAPACLMRYVMCRNRVYLKYGVHQLVTNSGARKNAARVFLRVFCWREDKGLPEGLGLYRRSDKLMMAGSKEENRDFANAIGIEGLIVFALRNTDILLPKSELGVVIADFVGGKEVPSDLREFLSDSEVKAAYDGALARARR